MKICYFGIYNSDFSRNKIYQTGLGENGVEIIECQDKSGGPIKFWRLFRKHTKIKDDYDVMIVGYPSQIAVPLAKLISNKKIILDALCPLYDGEVLSRRKSVRPLKRLKVWLIDFLAYHLADLVLFESNAQIDFCAKTFFLDKKKSARVFTGALDSVFFPDPAIKKRDIFTAVFRGQFLPEAGVEVILESAKILEDANVNFLFIGKGFLQKEITKKIVSMNLSNVFLVDVFMTDSDLRAAMLSSHISLGQFADNKRLEKTIPHKAFETLALGLPYLTGRAGGVSELLTDGETCLMSDLANPKDLADKILELKNNSLFRQSLADKGFFLYKSQLTPQKLASQILDYISERGFIK